MDLLSEDEYKAIDGDEEARISKIRETEYPALKEQIYLDHAGTALVAKSLVERFSADLTRNLYGNPHSNSASSQLSAQKVEKIRHDVLRFFNADPSRFDVVFVANATAGIKLVADALRDREEGFSYGYHVDAHTSLVGIREMAVRGSRCFRSNDEVESWLRELSSRSVQTSEGEDAVAAVNLFAYPAQSNMNGRRLPLRWTSALRKADQGRKRYYSLLDAAAYVSTTPLDLSDYSTAPDFTVCSFYKIFGFPDLGGLIVRRDSADVFRSRKYFGGGTVDMVVAIKEIWHARKDESIYSSLEDGTIPVHNIIALGHALDVHRELFGSHHYVSKRAAFLARIFFEGLCSLRHSNGKPLCVFYSAKDSKYDDATAQGPTIAFNMQNAHGAWILNSEVEKLAMIEKIHIRAGGLCNPGGLATSLGLEPWEIKRNFSAGHRCGSAGDVISGKPTGMLRVSLGAMSILKDIQTFVSFLRDFFVDDSVLPVYRTPISTMGNGQPNDFYVESLTIYPIKSCGGWRVPVGHSWEIRQEGLAWDREWCLIQQGTGKVMNQKNHPRMALFRPVVDIDNGVLRIRFAGQVDKHRSGGLDEITVPLSADPNYFDEAQLRDESSSVCGEKFQASAYRSIQISEFFSEALGVSCQLARMSVIGSRHLQRQAKAYIQNHQLVDDQHASEAEGDNETCPRRPILLSNESPILTISRSSLNRLNEQIKAHGGKAAQAEVFRANIVIAQEFGRSCGMEQPYIEDYWRILTIGDQRFQVLGSCRRCQMVCIDQNNAEKNGEPFITLSKTRRFDGKVWFGQHMCHLPSMVTPSAASQHPTITVGASVTPLLHGEHSQSLLRQAGVVA